MTQIIPFESAQLPAHLTRQPLGNTLSTSSGLGFPTISIKGKVFHVRRGDGLVLISEPDDKDAPARYIDVVILNGNPGTAKVWYAAGYTEGSDTKPSCYSNDGVAPASDAAEPQANKCAICPKNVWGSRVTDDGKKGRECGDSKRLAVATSNAIEDAMLIRVPAASLKAFNEYLKFLDTRGVSNYQAVVTRIGFDYSVAHPALTFKPVGFLDEGTFAKVAEMVESDLVGQIIGTITSSHEDGTPAAQQDAPVAKPVPEKKAKPAAKPAAPEVPAQAAPEFKDPEPKVKVKVEGEAAPAKPVAKPAVVIDDLDEGLDAALDNIDWDD